MRKWIFYPVLASAGFVLPVALINVASAETSEPAAPSDAAEEATAPSQAAGASEEAKASEPEAPEMPTTAQTPAASAAEEEPAAPEAPGVSTAPPPSDEATMEYVVQEGDTLGDIAREHLGSVEAWRRIAELNGIADPAKLSVGTRLKLPVKEERGS